MQKAYLVLSDGSVFEGSAFGADASAKGEIVFTTDVCGYMETLSDPKYTGKIVLQTFPLIGNYGAIPEDLLGECTPAGYVVRECCEHPSNFRSVGTLDAFLKERGIPGICQVDTRAITRKLRGKQGLTAKICKEMPIQHASMMGDEEQCH